VADDPLAELRNGVAHNALSEKPAKGEKEATVADAKLLRDLAAAKTEEEVADILERSRAV